MTFAFFGTPRFSAIILRTLIGGGMRPAVIVTNPDKPQGRKRVVTPPPVKAEVRDERPPLHILQPERPQEISAQLDALRPDLSIVAAYAHILPESLVRVPRYGTIGVHPSLLPKYRGPSPIQSALLSGEAETGVTLYLLDGKIDHGPLLAQRRTLIGARTYATLEEHLARSAGELLLETLPKFLGGKLVPVPQDESAATQTKKFRSEDAYIPLETVRNAESGSHPADAARILRIIKALNPEPGAWTKDENGKRIKLLSALIRGAALVLTETQTEGKKPLRRPA